MADAFLIRSGGGVAKQEKTVTPRKDTFTVTPDKGKLLSKVTVNGDPDLVPSNIKSGVNIFDVIGTMEVGVDLKSLLWCDNIVIDKFTFLTGTLAYNNPVPHSFGSKPQFALLFANDVPQNADEIIMAFVGKDIHPTAEGYSFKQISKYKSSDELFTWNITGGGGIVTESTITFQNYQYSPQKFAVGIEYTLITMA